MRPLHGVVLMKHEFSLASKLATLDVGHVIYLDDNDPVAEGRLIATQMERQVTNIISKSKKLKGRKFSTARCDVVIGRTMRPIIRIERTE